MSHSEPVRVAVVGVGAMGANHARVLSTLKGAELVAVVDRDISRARWVAEQFGGRPFASVDHCEGMVDAATVAVPSTCHLEVGRELLLMGVDCLIEKPLAQSAQEAAVLCETAEVAGRRLLVGHIERFNPAVQQLGEILRGGARVMALDARRMSRVSARVTDVDVVKDLMIHDIEIVLHLVGADPVDVASRTVKADGDGMSYVSALLQFENGALACLTASRITHNQVRQLEVTTATRLYSVNYSAQELQIFRQDRIGELAAGVPDGQYVLDVATEKVFVRRVEPLAAELAHFIACVRGDTEPLVDGRTGLRALRVADEIIKKVRR